MHLNDSYFIYRLRLPNKPNISSSTVHRILDGQLISLKKLEPSQAERSRLGVKEGRRTLAQLLLHESFREIISVDETGYYIWISRTRGRTRKGLHAVRVVGGRKCGNFSLIVALSNTRGLLSH